METGAYILYEAINEWLLWVKNCVINEWNNWNNSETRKIVYVVNIVLECGCVAKFSDTYCWIGYDPGVTIWWNAIILLA